MDKNQPKQQYSSYKNYLKDLRGDFFIQNQNICMAVESLISASLYKSAGYDDDLSIKDLMVKVYFISNWCNLQTAYEAALNTFYHSALILIRSSFEALLQLLYLITAPDKEANLFAKYLQKKNPLAKKEKDEIKQLTKSHFAEYSPAFFRNKLFNDPNNQSKLKNIRKYYREISKVSHENWESVFEIFKVPNPNTIEIVNEVANLLIWFVLVHYETLKQEYSLEDKQRISSLLVSLSLNVPGVYDFYPTNGNFRDSQVIIDEMRNAVS